MRPEFLQASELLRQKTPESVEEALGLLQGTVFSFSMKMCGHREDAEDTTQDVLFGSLKYLVNLQEPGELAAWLYTVTRNRCRRKRSKKNVSDRHHLSLDELMPDKEEMQRILRATEASPEKQALLAEQYDFLQDAILQLPIPLRLVLVLHDMEELATEEVARILGLQVGTVRVRLHRARLAVRKEWTRRMQGLPEKSSSTRQPTPSRPAECRALFARLSEYIDSRLSPKDCGQMREHIEKCPTCVAFLNNLSAAIDRCRSLKTICDPAVTQRMRALMTQEYLRLIGTQAYPDWSARSR